MGRRNEADPPVLTELDARRRTRADRADRAEGAEGAGGTEGTGARVLPLGQTAELHGEGGGEPVRMWHVVLNVEGDAAPLPALKRGLEQLANDHPPFLTARYATDHAEIRYWEQADTLQDAAALALRLWGEHIASAGLPRWEIVGLEVIDRPIYHQRVAEGYADPPPALGSIHPY